MGKGKVLVTGATGFVAGHCIRELAENGYQVRGTVRSLEKSDVSHLGALGELEFAQARLDSDDGWDEAARGCDYLLHVASPIPFTAPKREDDVIRPAVDGTLRALRAAAGAGIRRAVLTSSLDAICHDHAAAGHVRTEEDWSDLAQCSAYAKSKVLAERAAWDLSAARGLEVVTLMPGAVLGPALTSKRGSSTDVIRRMLAREMPAIPPLSLAYTDVRDLAAAHRLALEVPAAAGNRYICAGDPMPLSGIAKLLAEEYGPRGYRVSLRTLPAWVLRAAAPFSGEARLAADMLGTTQQVSSGKAERELGWVRRPARETVIDTAEDLIAKGVLAPPRHRREDAVA
ncbi:MAG: NAD-dependent epimerase/dehydratase family protein [Streptosporangiales bacterium]|nr:NAD-dependent epimerase/dehydratase family protein [Streptosporangiales bacterium]